jgi:hypothetical protein
MHNSLGVNFLTNFNLKIKFKLSVQIKNKTMRENTNSYKAENISED